MICTKTILSHIVLNVIHVHLFALFFLQINEVLNGLFFNESIVNRIANQFETEMNLALNEKFDESSLLMENTYIPELPDGTGLFRMNRNTSILYRMMNDNILS